MAAPLVLVSHPLCPYVQRAVIVADEKGLALERVDIDLAAKPDWFRHLSPTGKVPLLRVGDAVLFESAPIGEYLDEVSPGSLHPADPVERARHRAWIDFASAMLADIAGLYGAADGSAFEAKRAALVARLVTLEGALDGGPYFAGARFHMVDAVFGPVFRYFDVVDRTVDLDLFAHLTKVPTWREHLASRPAVARAVTADYPDRLERFLRGRGSHLSRIMDAAAA